MDRSDLSFFSMPAFPRRMQSAVEFELSWMPQAKVGWTQLTLLCVAVVDTKKKLSHHPVDSRAGVEFRGTNIP